MSSSDATTRRVVTGHDAKGRAVFVADEPVPAAGLAEDAGRTDAYFFQLWTTAGMPADNSDAALAGQRLGSMSTIVGSGGGTVLRIGVLEPGARSPMHRTESLDYGLCLEGECDLELDSGEVVTLRAGDVVVQRGTNHLWHNRSSELCRFAWILIDAAPISVGDGELAASWEYDDEPGR
jgi:quercetin dioxygenase-like cupin family protein